MLRVIFGRQIDQVERRFGYDATYLRQMLRISWISFIKFGILTQLVDRKAAPGELLAAAGIAATLVEDCGPCTQISVDKFRDLRIHRRQNCGQITSASYFRRFTCCPILQSGETSRCHSLLTAAVMQRHAPR